MIEPTEFKPCDEDHMHRWERSATEYGVVVCTKKTHDNPEPVDAEMSYIIEDIEWVSVKHPVVASLAKMVADAKKDLVADVESSVLGKLKRETTPRWLDPDRPTIRELYGSTRNYFEFRAALTSLNRGRG